MTEDMVIDSAYNVLGGLDMTAPGDPGPVNEAAAKEILRDWRRYEGSEKFMALVELLRKGHEVPSPHVPSFRYRAGSDAGRQTQLF